MRMSACIRPRFWFKDRHFFRHHSPKAGEHAAQYGINPDAQEAITHLYLAMAIPKVESAAQQSFRTFGAHNIDGLHGCTHARDKTRFACQQITIAQYRAACCK